MLRPSDLFQKKTAASKLAPYKDCPPEADPPKAENSYAFNQVRHPPDNCGWIILSPRRQGALFSLKIELRRPRLRLRFSGNGIQCRPVMKSIRKLLGYDDKFFDLLEASAQEAHTSVQLLVAMLQKQHHEQTLEEFAKTRRKDKHITEEITEQLCKTFVTPLEREDIEALSVALYKIPKTIEKFSEKYLICRKLIAEIDFSPQVNIMAEATDVVIRMIQTLRHRPSLRSVKQQNDRLHDMEGEADKLMFALIKDLYNGQHNPLKVIVITDLYETLEKIIDRCRDAGNIIFQVVLKYS